MKGVFSAAAGLLDVDGPFGLVAVLLRANSLSISRSLSLSIYIYIYTYICIHVYT